jgi:uncharacterized NAD(P)/FAD-binding protein YdhS
MDKVVRIAIIGAGLSGTQFICNFIDEIKRKGLGAQKLKVSVFDKQGEFGKGIAYGKSSYAGFLLNDPLHIYQNEKFEKWLVEHKKTWLEDLIHVSRQGNVLVQNWLESNKSAIESNMFQDCYIPRMLFGHFQRELLYRQVNIAFELKLLNISFEIECIEKIRKDKMGYSLFYQGGNNGCFDIVVYCGGKPKVKPVAGLIESIHYVDCLYSKGLAAALSKIKAKTVGISEYNKLTLVIVGSNSSAIEFIYGLGCNKSIIDKIGTIKVVSPSGILAGVTRNENGEILRVAPSEYSRIAIQLLDEKKLSIVAGRITAACEHYDGIRVECNATQTDAESVIDANIVINCSGFGQLHNSMDPLASSLASPNSFLTLNDLKTGFVLMNEFEAAKGFFILGPMLGSHEYVTHVERIDPIYKKSAMLASLLYQDICKLKIHQHTSIELLDLATYN